MVLMSEESPQHSKVPGFLQIFKASVTRAFFEIVELFGKNLGKKLWKRPILCKKDKVHVIRYNLLVFYY